MPEGEVITIAIENSNPSADGGGARAEPAGAVVIGPSVCVGVVDRAGKRVMRVLAQERINEVGRSADDLTCAADRACKAAGVIAKQIGLVAVSAGPGGYTSLRMACATGKMIALAAGAACVRVPTAAVGALGTTDTDDSSCGGRALSTLVVLASKGESVHVTIVEPAMVRAGNEPAGRVCAAAELETLAQTVATHMRIGRVVCDQHVPLSVKAWAVGAGLAVEPLRLSAWNVLRCAAWLPMCERAALVPLYAREPEAVTLWRKARGSSPKGGVGGV